MANIEFSDYALTATRPYRKEMNFKKPPYAFLSTPEDQLSGLKLNGLSLDFEGESSELEAPFLKSYIERSLPLQRLAVLIGAVMTSVFGLLDFFVLGESFEIISGVRFGILLPATVCFLLYTKSALFRKRPQLSMTVFVILMGFGLSSIVILAPVEVSPLYFAGNMLVIFFAYSFLSLRFIWANFAGWGIFFGFALLDLIIGKTAVDEQFMRTFFTSSTCLLGMFVAYSAEFFARRDFYLSASLRQRSAELERNQNDLEARVHMRTQQALLAAKAKTDFLANMSHEIRTPMNGVLGMLDLVRDSELNSEQKEKIDTAFNSAEGLLDVINDVLDLSKIEAGKMTLNKKPIAPAMVVEDVICLLSPQFKEKELPLVGELDPETFDSYMLDRTRLRQIILNLLGNALKFTDRGEVKISCSVVEGVLKIEIRDTGIGILDQQLENLFEAFSQVDNSSAREFGGTGLGLSISKQLTELMNGTISVESRFSVGSAFSLEIPVRACPQSDLAAGSVKILKNVFFVVESQHYSRSVRLLLKRLGCTICRLADADVAITDMPDIECGGLPVVFLQNGKHEQSKAERSNPNNRRELKLPFTLDSLAAQLSDGQVEAPIVKLSTPDKAFRDHNVLLVEDNVINQKVASSMMKKLGVTADVAVSGQEALDKFSSQKYSLIFMDCQMPGMDGFETTQAIRKLENRSSLKPIVIVALTANAMEGDRKRCLDAGMDDYIPKPISLAGLEQVFDRWDF